MLQEDKRYGYVPLSKVKAAIQQIEDHYQDSPERMDDIQITFEYLVGSFFPKIIENINAQMIECFREGYGQGLKDAGELYSNANQGNN